MYHMREVTFKNEPTERKALIIEFDDPKMGIVGEFLMTDSSLVNYGVLDELEEVLAGEHDYIESSGNRCSLEIKQDKTLIADLFEGMFDGFDTFPAYEIETKALRDLIVMWKGSVEAFNDR